MLLIKKNLWWVTLKAVLPPLFSSKNQRFSGIGVSHCHSIVHQGVPSILIAQSISLNEVEDCAIGRVFFIKFKLCTIVTKNGFSLSPVTLLNKGVNKYFCRTDLYPFSTCRTLLAVKILLVYGNTKQKGLYSCDFGLCVMISEFQFSL